MCYLTSNEPCVLNVEIFFEEEEDPTWRSKHPLGPVHVKLRCKLCDAIVAEDKKEFG